MADRDAKIRRVADLKAKCPRMSASALTTLIEEIRKEGLPDPVSRADVKLARESVVKTQTPLGTLHQSTELTCIDGSTYTMEICDPLAMWWHVLRMDTAFSRFVEQRMQEQPPDVHTPWSLIMYSDEVVPGNPLESGNLRKVQTVYYSFKELGPLALMCETSWFVITVIRSDIVSKIRDGMSQVMAALLRHVASRWCDCGLPFEFGGSSVRHVRMFVRLRILVQDEKAHKQSYEVKGASGTKPCLLCRNVVSARSDVAQFATGNIVDICEHDVSKLVLHTDGTMRAAARHLATVARTANKATLELNEQAYGINYCPYGLLFDSALEPYLMPVSVFMSDWMHVFVVGGCFNYHMRNLLRDLHGLRPAFDVSRQLGDYVEAWNLPGKFGRRSLKGETHPVRRIFDLFRMCSRACCERSVINRNPLVFMCVRFCQIQRGCPVCVT